MSRSACELDREAPQRPAQRVADGAADEEQVGEDAAEAGPLELVGELEADLAAAADAVEAHALRAVSAARPRRARAGVTAGSYSSTCSTTRPRPLRSESHTIRVPGCGQSPSSRASAPKPSTNDDQRARSNHSRGHLVDRGARQRLPRDDRAHRPQPSSSRRIRSTAVASSSRRGADLAPAGRAPPRRARSAGRSAASGARGAPTRPPRGPRPRARAAADTSCSG